ncbi:MAG: sulfite exporter TauE/SafE family protein [Longimicrobiales bacterium]
MSVPLFIPLATALLLGSVHALETDHMAAVSAFVARRPGTRAAIGFGARWAFGHGVAILLVGALLMALGLRLPQTGEPWLERAAGLALVVVGVWTASGARALHAHRHAHADGTVHTHLHAHEGGIEQPHAERHDHRHAVTAVGALHGLAGTAPVLALLPLTDLHGPVAAGLYLVSFGVGTALAMVMYALLAGWVAGRAAERSTRIAQWIARATGFATALVGIVWILR